MHDELQQLLDRQPKPVCAQLTPFRIIDANLEAGSVRLEFAPQPAFGNHFGNVQGRFAVGMIDVLLSVCAYAKYRLWLLTAEIKTSFVGPLPMETCLGEGKVHQGGAQSRLSGRILADRGWPARDYRVRDRDGAPAAMIGRRGAARRGNLAAAAGQNSCGCHAICLSTVVGKRWDSVTF